MSTGSDQEALARDPHALLQAWLSDRAHARRDPISKAQRRHYELLWEHWLSFLARRKGSSAAQLVRGRAWLRPDPASIREFLVCGRSEESRANARREVGRDAGGRGAARGARITERYSATTQRRYWRVLQRIYEFALVGRKLAGEDVPNPISPIALELRLESEAPQGLVLSIPVWNAIPKTLGATQTEPFTLRNRAAVLLMMDAAITPGELLALRLRDVGRELFGTGVLRLDGPRKAQQRQLHVGADTLAALEAWARLRRADARGDDPVFVSERGTQLSRSQLYLIVAAAVRSAERECGVEAAAKPSPMVLRNTRLVIRLRNGEDPHQVAELAGLKSTAGLKHLEHAFKDQQWRAFQTWPGTR